MATIDGSINKGTLDGTEKIPISGGYIHALVSDIYNYIISFFTNKTTLDLLGVSDSTLQYNGIDVNNGFRKVSYTNKTSDFTVALGENTKLMYIDVKNASSLAFWVGTSLAADDIVEDSSVTSEDTFNLGGKFISADTTLYISIDAGQGDFIISYYKNW